MTDARTHYVALSDEVFKLYGQGSFDEAIRRVDGASGQLRPWSAELAHLKACLHGYLGQHAAALAALQKAHDLGGWWKPEILTGDEDLAGLQNLAAFQEMVASSRQRWAQANRKFDRSGDRLGHPQGPPRGIVVALHGADQNASDAQRQWSAATAFGFAVLSVRSSQRTSPMYRSWPDQGVAENETRQALDRLPAVLGRLPVVAAGFSAGARAALVWAISGRDTRVVGVIAVAPAMKLDQVPINSVDNLSPARLLVGEDDDQYEDVQRLAGQLTTSGFTLDVVRRLAHDFPTDFAERLGDYLEVAPEVSSRSLKGDDR